MRLGLDSQDGTVARWRVGGAEEIRGEQLKFLDAAYSKNREQKIRDIGVRGRVIRRLLQVAARDLGAAGLRATQLRSAQFCHATPFRLSAHSHGGRCGRERRR